MATDTPTKSPTAGLVIPLALVALAAVVFGVFFTLNQGRVKDDPTDLLNGYVANAGKFSALAEGYADADGDLVADAPADAMEPAELYFTDIPSCNPDKDAATWAAFLEHMHQATGKPCKYLTAGVGGRPLDGFEGQLDALRAGKLHVTAFTTGQVRQAVNTAGFRPLVVPADKDGKFAYQIKVVVPADSPAKTVADLKGKRLGVSALSSNSSAKAPFVFFHDEFGLFPARDYSVVLAGSYWAALGQMLQGKVDAVCLSSDLLAQELDRPAPTEEEANRGRVQLTADKVRVIYTSGDYPKLCFGVAHALPPALVEKIRRGFESFTFEGTAVGEKYGADGAVKFRPVEYKKDWEAVRKVDDRLVEILKAK